MFGKSLLLCATVSLSACATDPANQASADAATIAPLALTKLQNGDVHQFVDQVSGDNANWTVTAIDGDLITQTNQDSCAWTSSGDPTMPSTTWNKCGSGEWATGGIKNQKNQRWVVAFRSWK